MVRERTTPDKPPEGVRRPIEVGGYHTIPLPSHPAFSHPIPSPPLPHHTATYHTTPYHTTPYHTTPYHTPPYHTLPNYTTPQLTLRLQVLEDSGNLQLSCSFTYDHDLHDSLNLYWTFDRWGDV